MRHGEPTEVLELVESADAPAGQGRLVVEPDVVGLGMPDVLMIRGEYQRAAAFPMTVGGELAGTVVDAPDDSPFTLGQRVMATRVEPGGLADRVLADVSLTDAIPSGVPSEVAASIPVNYVTAHLALHRRARLSAGETVVVIGGGGGVGSAAIQLAIAAGARVLATARDGASLEACRALGADVAIDVRAESISRAVLEQTNGRGAEVIIDPVGGDSFDESCRCVAFEGRIVVVGFVGGRIADLRTNQLLLRSFSAMGVNNGKTMQERPEAHRAARQACLSLAADRQINPLIGGVWPFEEAPAALTAVAAGAVLGKVLVAVRT
jgi:NADPH2:quinone reductase